MKQSEKLFGVVPGLGGLFGQNNRMMPTIYCLFILGILYISSAHFVEKRMRNIQALKGELKELRWEYMTVKSDLMFNSTYSQVLGSVSDGEQLKSASIPKRIYVRG
jgi:hypothetical protein